jgi:hypothetical protein
MCIEFAMKTALKPAVSLIVHIQVTDRTGAVLRSERVLIMPAIRKPQRTKFARMLP